MMVMRGRRTLLVSSSSEESSIGDEVILDLVSEK